jgi:deazaflavin-dependent oxidoreductase (nitroreductase family)
MEPVARALAGRRWFPLWAIVHHRGRRSGTDYATPVAVVPTVDKSIVMIGLPWGRKTNWARNVVAAGGATLTWKGRERPTTQPRIIEPTEAAALAKPLFRFVLRRMPGAIVLKREAG